MCSISMTAHLNYKNEAISVKLKENDTRFNEITQLMHKYLKGKCSERKQTESECFQTNRDHVFKGEQKKLRCVRMFFLAH